MWDRLQLQQYKYPQIELVEDPNYKKQQSSSTIIKARYPIGSQQTHQHFPQQNMNKERKFFLVLRSLKYECI